MTFNEPVADVVGVDPSQFLVGLGISEDHEDDELDVTSYVDLGHLIWDTFQENRTPVSIRGSWLENGEDTRVVLLGLSQPLTDHTCAVPDNTNKVGVDQEVNLFAHYDARMRPIRSNDGDELASFGSELVDLASGAWSYTVIGLDFPDQVEGAKFSFTCTP